MSTVIDIAKAVVTALNDATMSQTFTAVRAYNHRINKEDLSDTNPTVAVVPATIEGVIVDRGIASDKHYGIDIGIQQKLTSTADASRVATNAAMDPLMTFAEEVVTLFLGQDIGSTKSKCIGYENEIIFSQTDLQAGEFLTVVRLIVRKVA